MIDYLVLLVLLSCILVVLGCYYWSYVRKYGDFPSYSMVTVLVYAYLMKRIPENVSFTTFIFQELINMCTQFSKEGLCLTWFGEPVLFVYSEEAIKIFTSEKSAIDHPSFNQNFEFVLGKGLLTSNGERWKQQRKLLNPLFHVGKLKDKIPVFNRNAAILVQRLKEMDNKPTEDTHSLLQYCFFKTLCESMLDDDETKIEICDAKKKHISDSIDKIMEFIVHKISHPWYNWRFSKYLFSIVRKNLKLRDEIYSITQEWFDDSVERIISNKSTNSSTESDSAYFSKSQKSFLGTLMELHLKDPSFTMKDVQDQFNTFLVAGIDTVSYTLTYCLFHLGLHPDIQEQVYHEVTSVVNNDVKHEDLHKLSYLDCIIKETLRLTPTVPLYARFSSKNVQCGKYLVPKGTAIVMFTYMWHRDPKFYPDPETFDPNRFLEGNPGKRPWTHLTFAEGIRNCIGKNYAMIEMKVFLAHIIHNFKITALDRREDLDLSWHIILTPARHIQMQFTPRYLNLQSDE